jgi:DNA-binding transcriptional MerR regulator/effector-binding domain-containing protein
VRKQNRIMNTPALYSIGEFSQITGLSIKTLRFYHEKSLLVPTRVDEATGYRFYDESKVDKARVIAQLRAMEFSLEDIAAILAECADDTQVLAFLERQKGALESRIRQDRDIVRSLDQIIAKEREAQSVARSGKFQIEEKTLSPLLVAGIRMTGRYSDCGKGFARLCRALGRHLSGQPLCLYHDGEYREDDANFEPCVPLRKEVTADGLVPRTLPGGRFLTLVHQGPYDTLGRSYARLLDHVRERSLKIILPAREVYLKGPGMIFKGNPKKYLTEIQLPVEA